MIATAGAEDYRQAIAALARWDGIDSLIAIFIRPLATRAEDVATAVGAAVAELPRELPVQAVFMSPDDHASLREAAAVPIHLYPEDAARALGKVVRHVRWRQSPPPSSPVPSGIHADQASAILAEALGDGLEWLDPERCERLLDSYGIATPVSRLAGDPESAGLAAEEIGGKVALKAAGPQILHKTEIGAVALGLAGAEEVAEAARRMDGELASRGLTRTAFSVQAMVEDGVELLVGIATDPVFGPVVACGAGGTAVELMGDVQLRVCPLDATDPAEMLDGLAIRPLLDGYRGAKPADLRAIEDLIARVGAIAEAHHEIVELDLNPVIATPDGAIATDARVRLLAVPPQRSWPSTWD
jgi:acetate---CoA ligase (ADP-forming)